jgi:hypothetical protein
MDWRNECAGEEQQQFIRQINRILPRTSCSIHYVYTILAANSVLFGISVQNNVILLFVGITSDG